MESGLLQVGAIHKMATGVGFVLKGDEKEVTVVVGLIDYVDIPEGMGGGYEDVRGISILEKCPVCGDVEPKPALVLTSGRRLSECLSCKQFLWYVRRDRRV